MFKKILVTLENAPPDETIIPHAKELAKQFDSELVLLHVADGWVARNFYRLKLAESDEMRDDRAYLDKVASSLRAEGLVVTTALALGNPPTEILKVAEAEQCNLIAMASHGHRLFGDLFHGSTINEVRHKTHIPIHLIRARKK